MCCGFRDAFLLSMPLKSVFLVTFLFSQVNAGNQILLISLNQLSKKNKQTKVSAVGQEDRIPEDSMIKNLYHK